MPRRNKVYFVAVLFITAIYYAQRDGRLSITMGIALFLVFFLGAYFYVNEGK